MKKIIFSSLLMLLTANLFAQSVPPIAERWKRDSIKLQLYVNINPEQIASIKNTFVTFYNTLDATLQKGPANPPPKEDIDNMIKTRNDSLKKILNEKQFDRFETFEHEFMPPPPGPGDKRARPSQL